MQCPQVKSPSALLEGEPHNSPVTLYHACNQANTKRQEIIKDKTGRQQFPLQKHTWKWYMSRKKLRLK